ncbi:MAG: ATP-binding cassette domain-containing protein [Deltaproteobacteria bacterium]|jgi:ABC-type glutathione transport system ATPase component|nr:ATP-binding cassette domain-containing protein [Deltaproteobacteria bacterium]
MDPNILEVDRYGVSFHQYTTFFKKGFVEPVIELNLTVRRNEITTIVGASGSGKSLLAHGIMGILPENAREKGSIVYQGQPLDRKRIQSLLPGEIVLIPQSINYLDPLMTVGRQIKSLVRKGDPDAVLETTFQRYGLKPEVAGMYPFQISGGMARRVLIATAVVQNPTLIIADEPTPGLDEDLVAEALEQLIRLKEDGCSILMITHDLQAAKKVSDKIVVFKDGRSTCEIPRDIFDDAGKIADCSQYAADLFKALPENDFVDLPARPPAEVSHELEARGLSFSYYGGRRILDSFDFSLNSGEVVGLRGGSGRGKSTFAKLLSGYLNPTSGAIMIDGNPVPRSGFNPIQLIYQHPEKSLDPRWRMRTCLEEAGEVSEEIRRVIGINTIWLNRLPHEISGGEQQRFCIARILQPEVKFLIADEMTAMFDAITQAEIWAVTAEYARAHSIGLLIISHDPSLLNRLCDRIVYI